MPRVAVDVRWWVRVRLGVAGGGGVVMGPVRVLRWLGWVLAAVAGLGVRGVKGGRLRGDTGGVWGMARGGAWRMARGVFWRLARVVFGRVLGLSLVEGWWGAV